MMRVTKVDELTEIQLGDTVSSFTRNSRPFALWFFAQPTNSRHGFEDEWVDAGNVLELTLGSLIVCWRVAGTPRSFLGCQEVEERQDVPLQEVLGVWS